MLGCAEAESESCESDSSTVAVSEFLRALFEGLSLLARPEVQAVMIGGGVIGGGGLGTEAAGIGRDNMGSRWETELPGPSSMLSGWDSDSVAVSLSCATSRLGWPDVCDSLGCVDRACGCCDVVGTPII